MDVAVIKWTPYLLRLLFFAISEVAGDFWQKHHKWQSSDSKAMQMAINAGWLQGPQSVIKWPYGPPSPMSLKLGHK